MPEVLLDRKSNCYSIVSTFKLSEYLSLVDKAYSEGGGLDGQRNPISSKSAKRIRNRMVDDFIHGAVLPPVVIGIASGELFSEIDGDPGSFDLKNKIDSVDEDDIAIIDGMQRTTAMYEAFLKVTENADKDELSERRIRVEFWVAKDTSSLIYRMLVLNTGQVPWNLRRQLEVILRPLKSEIERSVDGIKLIAIDDAEYRKEPGSFQADRVLELYLLFASRKEKVDAKEQVAEEYARLDIIETSSRESVIGMFCDFLKRLVMLDQVLWGMSRTEEGRFREGKDFLNSQPVLSSLVSVVSQYILGRPGWDNDGNVVRKRERKVYEGIDSFLNKLAGMNQDERKEFMDFETLNEIVANMRGGKVGDTERAFFRDAFRVLLEEEFEVPNMGVCWRS